MHYRIRLRDDWLASLLLDKSQQRLDIKAVLLFQREVAAPEVAAVAMAAAEGACGALGRGATGGMGG